MKGGPHISLLSHVCKDQRFCNCYDSPKSSLYIKQNENRERKSATTQLKGKDTFKMAASFVSRSARTLYRYFDLRFYLETRLLTIVASRFFFLRFECHANENNWKRSRQNVSAVILNSSFLFANHRDDLASVINVLVFLFEQDIESLNW